MKEEWRISEKELLALEESLRQKKKECIKNPKSKSKSWKKWMRYIKLILYLEFALFFGWSCYTLFQTYRFQATEIEVTDIIRKRYSMMLESQLEAHPNAETPVVFVKPEVILSKLNRLPENVELTEKQDLMQDVTTVTDADNANKHHPITVQSSFVKIPSTADSMSNEEFTKSSISRKIHPTGYADEVISADTDKESNHYAQFPDKLHNIAETKTSDLENKNDFAGDTNSLNNQENHALDAPNALDNFMIDVTTNPKLEDSASRQISASPAVSNMQDMKQEFPDFTGDVTQSDRSTESSNNDDSDEQVNASSQPGSVAINSPSTDFHEFPDMSSEWLDGAEDFSIPRFVSPQKASEEIENSKADISRDDVAARNKDKHDVDDSNVSMSTSDVTASKSDDARFSFDKLMAIVQNIKDQYSSEIRADIKEDEKYESTENIEDPSESLLSRLKVHDRVESLTPNIDMLRWFTPPAHFADDPQYGLKSESESSKFLDKEIIEDDILPYNCQTETVNLTIRVKCGNSFDKEELDYDYYTEYDEDTKERLTDELISNQNSDIKEIVTPQEDIRKIIYGFNGGISNANILNDTLSDLSVKTNIVPVNGTKDSQEEPVYKPNENKMELEVTTVSPSNSKHDSRFESISDIINSDEEWNPSFEFSDTRQREQQNINENQDLLNIRDMISSEIVTLIHASDNTENVTSEIIDEITDRLRDCRYLSNSCYDCLDKVCEPYRPHTILHTWCQRYTEVCLTDDHYIGIPNFLRKKFGINYRKRRMVDDPTSKRKMMDERINELRNCKYLFNCYDLDDCADKVCKPYRQDTILHSQCRRYTEFILTANRYTGITNFLRKESERNYRKRQVVQDPQQEILDKRINRLRGCRNLFNCYDLDDCADKVCEPFRQHTIPYSQCRRYTKIILPDDPYIGVTIFRKRNLE